MGERAGQKVLCQHREAGMWKRYDGNAFSRQIRCLSVALHKLGLQKGDTVGFLAPPSFHWLVADFAIQVAGGISVPLYMLTSKENIEFKIRDAALTYAFVLGVEAWSLFEPFASSFRHIITLGIPSTLSACKDWETALALGAEVERENPGIFETLCAQVQEEDIATILYTSGSTGNPKGVELTQKNFVSQLKGAGLRFPLDGEKDRALSYLPLAHSFERMIVYYYLSCGVEICFVDDVKQLGELLREMKPSVMTTVPRVLEKVFSKIETQSLEARGIRGKIARWALKHALAKDPETFQKSWQKKIADVLVFRKIRASFGGQLLYLIAGGAATPFSLYRFYINVDIPLYQGYGLTECSPVVSVNAPGQHKIGSVGKSFPEVELKLGSDGELWVKGPNVMRGYHNLPEQTQAIIDSKGWLRTGDLAQIDEEGFVTITGRIKELFKTSGGEYVSPLPMEQALCESPWIETAMVVAEGRRFVTALLFPNFDHLNRMKKIAGVDVSDEAFLNSSEIQAHVDRVNARLNPWEKIKRFRIVFATLSVATGELTPTLKLRRHVVCEKYSDLIEQMYE
jgi:long-chain acyl-CoA synthetase